MTEYWVMRVIGPAGMKLTVPLAAKLASGELSVVSGELCEPIECFADQERANARALSCHRRTGQVHKVVLSADLCE